MKKNKIISILESSIRNKLVISFLAISLIGASSMFLTYQNNISNTNLVTNKILLAKTTDLSNDNSYTIYTVQSGNTLSQIAYTYGVTVSKLQQWNNILNPNEIYIGQTLKIYTNSSSGTDSPTNNKNSNKSNSSSTTKNNSYTIYTVQSGNTLSQIAYTYGVTVTKLQQWNNILNPNEIYIGQTLKIYTNSSSGTDSPTNNKNSNKSNSSSPTKNNSYTTYTIQSGNTLSGIAYTYGVTVNELQQWNNISNPNEIYVGQTLKIYTNISTSSNSKSSSSTGQPLTKHTTTKSSSSSTIKKSSDQVSKKSLSNTTYKEGYIYNEWGMGLGIFEEPNENANVSVMLRDGTSVKVLETVNGFYKIEFNGDNIGYVSTGNIVFSKKLAGNPASISKVAYMYDPWSTGAIDVYENSEQLTTPEAALAQGTEVGYLGSSGNFDYIAFGPNYDEIAVVNSNFVTFQDPTISTKGTVRIGYVSADWAYTYVLGSEQSSFEGAVRNGAEVKIIGNANADGFYKIEFGNGELGYIQTSNIVFSKSEVQGPQSVSKMAYISSKDKVSVYTQLGDNNPETTLTEGTKVALLGSASSGYYYIAFGEDYSEVGIIPTKYLSFTEGTIAAVETHVNTKTSNTTVI